MARPHSFHTVPDTFRVTVTTEVNDSDAETAEFFLEPESATKYGIWLSITKGLKAGYPLLLHITPSTATEGTLTLATPDDFPFHVEVGLTPPDHIHIHRNLSSGFTRITCLIPLTKIPKTTDVEQVRQMVWDNACDLANDEAMDRDEWYDFAKAYYYGALMKTCNVLALDYTPGATSECTHFHSIPHMQRHFMSA